MMSMDEDAPTTASLPISSIHGLDTTVYFARKNKCSCSLLAEEPPATFAFVIQDREFHGNFKWTYYRKDFKDIKTDQDITIMMECIVRFIKNCVVNNLRGGFLLPDQMLKDKEGFGWGDFGDLFENIEHVKMPMAPCCVCHDWTMSKTEDCKHPLCISCLAKLPKVKCEECEDCDGCEDCEECDGIHNTRRCPMCRGDIVHGMLMSG